MKRTGIKPSSKPLQRGTPLQRKTPLRAAKAPMNRAGMETLRARNQDKPLDLDERGAVVDPLPPPGNRPKELPRRTRLKSKGPKMTPIRRAARGEDCTLRFPGVCNRDPDTSVWCHSNRSEHGKGGGKKAKDIHGCVGCSACHAFYDGGYASPNSGWTRDQVEARFDAAEAASREVLRAKGVLPPLELEAA
jgi:hypothetical protein